MVLKLLRYLLLSTHYRRPIEFTDEALANCKKALSVFTRLFERIERLTGEGLTPNSPDAVSISAPMLDSEYGGPFLRDILNLKIKFLEMMDDDFNTAGAAAVLHEIAGECNSFIERHDLERVRNDELLKAVAGATVTLRNLGMLLGLFRSKSVAKKDSGLADDLMALMIRLRQEARRDKNFALADNIRNSLTAIGVTLEDRADGTVWRKE